MSSPLSSAQQPENSSLSQEPALGSLIQVWLGDLVHANRSAHTLRAYAGELSRFATHHPGPPRAITPEVIRSFLMTRAHLAPASQARTEVALSSFLTWAYRHDHIDANPMARLDRVHLDPPMPRGLPPSQVEHLLGTIPSSAKRDRLLFGLITRCGLRVGEALGLYIEDLDLTPDDEHLVVHGKGGCQRPVLIDDDRLVRQLHAYLRETGYRHGPLFRAAKNNRGGPLRYQTVQETWARYCARAGMSCTLHQLRHSHATELVNDGVSLTTIRKRLGHRSMQTTLRYAEQTDTTADNELRAWRRRRKRG